MKPRTDQSPEDYRVPITPDGAVEFTPEAATGEERVELHMSSLDRMARDAINLAEPSHNADPTVVDTHRVEAYGGTVIDAAHRFAAPKQPERPLDLTDPATLIAHGTWVVRGFRQAELDERNKAA